MTKNAKKTSKQKCKLLKKGLEKNNIIYYETSSNCYCTLSDIAFSEENKFDEKYLYDKQHSDVTFEWLLQKWQKINDVRIKGGTKKKYDNLINMHILPYLGHLKLKEITATIINVFINDKLQNGRLNSDGGLSPSYVRSISQIILSALKYAVSEGLCQPIKEKIYKPSVIKCTPVILSVESQRILEQYIRLNLNATNIGIMISLYTGLRIGEICALSWQDVDLDEKIIFVRHTVARVRSTDGKSKSKLILDEPKTASSKRIIPIPSQIFSLLTKYKKISASPYVVSYTDSFVSPRTYEARFRKTLQECKIHCLNYHGLRHTFATRCIEAGVDTKSLSEILGHSNVSITLNTYVHSSLEMKKKQLEKLCILY